MLTIDALRQFGANVDEGLSRCMNNEAFYIRLVNMAAQDVGFDKLKEALVAGDQEAAFEAAHALKGVLGNLALTPLYAPTSELTELLRARAQGDHAGYLAEILRKRDDLKALCE